MYKINNIKQIKYKNRIILLFINQRKEKKRKDKIRRGIVDPKKSLKKILFSKL
jgi:hypothetical protein